MIKNRILIAPNSFKECADSVTIAELIKDNLNHLENAELIVKPISDGGDGFLNVCNYYFGGEIRTYKISTAYDETILDCPVLYIESKKEIYIESAEVLGLKKVPLTFRNPLKLSSKGLGELFLKIKQEIKQNKLNVEKVYVGIGGTATIDMGLGMMSKLGLKLIKASGEEVNVIPENFSITKSIDYNFHKLPFEIIPILDVTNPLLGRSGGIRIFGKQKGANDNTISYLEKSFNHIVNLLNNKGLTVSSKLLSGAGGGIPAALQIFYNSRTFPSSEFIKSRLGIQGYKENIDYLLTGEGAYDAQSDSGKGVKTLLEMFGSDSKQIFLICGKISGSIFKNLPKKVYPIELIKYFANEEDSIVNFREGIEETCKEIMKQINF